MSVSAQKSVMFTGLNFGRLGYFEGVVGERQRGPLRFGLWAALSVS